MTGRSLAYGIIAMLTNLVCVDWALGLLSKPSTVANIIGVVMFVALIIGDFILYKLYKRKS